MIETQYSHRLKGKKVLVTGASGFIGNHLCRGLILNGCEVHGVSRKERNTDRQEIIWWRMDLSNSNEVEKLVTTLRPDIIFHLASQVDGSRDLSIVIPMFHNNLLTSVNILTAACKVGCQRLLLIGSMEEPVSGNGEAFPGSPYAAAKWASSAYARMFHALYQLPVVILHVFMVYGPGQQDAKKLIPYIILSLLRGESPKLSSGQRQVDWIYIGDVVEGLLAAVVAEGINGNTIDIGSGKMVSIRAIAETLSRMINPKVELRFRAIPDRSLEQTRIADTIKANESLGWKPKTGIVDGLKLTVKWYKQKLDEGVI